MVIDADTWRASTHSADPFLHATLKRMASQLQIAQPDDSMLERALRARLRVALAQGRADPARMAVLLGVSERTLQRRLAELGRSFSDVVEDFRREEAARLLATPGLPLVEVVSRLGYAEQTSFTRAFRRWTEAVRRAPGETPRRRPGSRRGRSSWFGAIATSVSQEREGIGRFNRFVPHRVRPSVGTR